mmetsp:Transcript_56/g.206  ORF Transcript_56/g.206 Transcript_56/m.206 type:complete len:219 (-) Transcript_56:492-1148(-)
MFVLHSELHLCPDSFRAQGPGRTQIRPLAVISVLLHGQLQRGPMVALANDGDLDPEVLGVALGDAEPRPEKDLGDVTCEFGYRLTPLMPIGVGAPGHIQTERVPTRVPLLPEHCGDAVRLPVLQRHVFRARIHQEVRRISNRRARARGQNHGTSQDTVDVPHVATAGDAGGDVYVCVRIYRQNRSTRRDSSVCKGKFRHFVRSRNPTPHLTKIRASRE